jgi:peptidoglycan-associated lipoprotein
MAKSLEVPRFVPALLAVLMLGTLLMASPPPALAVDEVFLVSGGRLSGDLQDAELTLVTPKGPLRVNRANAWRLNLGTGAIGDVVDLRNGSRVSGQLDVPRYTLQLPGGASRTLTRAEVGTIKLGPPSGGPAEVRLPDAVLLTSGDLVYGDVSPTEFEVSHASGVQRFQRDTLWHIWLDSANGDGVELANGNRLTGVVQQGAYEVRTRDGQTLSFGRGAVKAIYLAQPPKPRAAVAPAVAAAVPVAPAPPPPPVPAAALPPAVRAVLRDLHFEFDRWELTPEARKTLEDVAAALKSFPSLKLLIEGHADERGTPEYNLALGARRAEAARDYLASLGIEAARLDTISYGEERPLDPAHNEVAWALNRRAHFAVKQ